MSKRYDIFIDQGSPFEMEIYLYDDEGNLDIEKYTSAAKMKKHYTSNTSISFDTNVSEGILTISMKSTVSANLVPGRYVYDAEIYLTTSDFAKRVVEGVVTVTPGVT